MFRKAFASANNALKTIRKQSIISQQVRQYIKPQQTTFTVYVDDKPVTCDPTFTVFQACQLAGVEIPRFCFHERLTVKGACRMCLVEVEGAPKLIGSCAINVRPSLKIKTKSEKTKQAQKSVMELLLINHPLDCPICDQGGECDLQDISVFYGYGEGRYNEYKRAVEDKYIGPLVKMNMNRCIHCTRCIRFTELIAGDWTMGMIFRGRGSEIGTYVDVNLTSEISGNLIDLCPTGALTNGPYAFTSRPWELKSNYTIDVMDGLCSWIDAHTRGSDLMRIIPRVNEEVNEEWISDKTRHAFDGLRKQRLTVPMERKEDGSFAELTWQEALKKAADKLSSVSGDEIQGIIGQFQDVESIMAFKDLLNRMNCENLDVRSNAPILDTDFRAQYLMNSTVVGIDETDLLILVGFNPKSECPVLNARIRKMYELNGLEVVIIGPANNMTFNYKHIGTSNKTLKEIADGTHPFCKRLNEAELPMLIVAGETLARPDGRAIMNQINKIGKNSNVINEDEAWNGINIFHKNASTPGKLDLGIKTKDSTEKPAKVVFLLGADNFYHEDIPEDAYVIYQGHTGDEGAYYADLILPAASYLEKNATFVNTDGRVQKTLVAQGPPGFARDDWMILRALSEELGSPLPYDSLDEIRTRMAELAPHLVRYDVIEPVSIQEFSNMPNDNDNLHDVLFTDTCDNFYITDPISRNSSVMAKCTRELNPQKQTNFKVWQNDWATH